MMWAEWTPEELRQQQDRRRERWLQNLHINPSAHWLALLCRAAEDGGLRGILHDGDLIWWKARYATHGDAIHWMKITGAKREIGVELHVCDDGEIGLNAFDDDAVARALQHPTLLGQFDAEGNLKPKRKSPR